MKKQNKLKKKVFGCSPLLAGGMIFGLGLLGLQAEETSGPLAREWKSENGKFSVLATLESVEVQGRKVVLRKSDSTLVRVPLSRLSEADQAYVRELNTRSGSTAPIGEPVRLHGIKWQPVTEEALTLAAGRPGPSDDQPVMWFRVLGQLDDGM
jgi:hypothetical protein